MEFSRKNGKGNAEESHKFDNIEDYVRWVVNVYASAVVLREMWLTEREKDFFVATVIHINKGIDNPISESAIQIYKKYFNFGVTKRIINNLIRKIQQKDWVEYDKEGRHIKIPAIFYGIGIKRDSFEFKLNSGYEAEAD